MKKIAILLSLIVGVCAQKGPILEFDGTDDYVDLGALSSTNFTTADFSIQAWVKTTSTKAQSILVKGDGDGVWDAGEKALYIESAGYPWFVGFDNEYIPGTGLKVNDGLWHHIVVTWDYSGSGTTGTAAIYVDGVKATVDPSYMAITGDNSEDKIYVGKAEAWEAQNYFDGAIAEVAIWGYALSSAEVLALHSAYLSANLTGERYALNTAAYYWKLAEGSGTSATNGEGTSDNGTIYGATWNTSPVIAKVSDVTINEDENTTITLSATDAEGEAITYDAFIDTNAVTFSISSSTLTLTPNANWNGLANCRVYASDGSSWNSTLFKLIVTEVQDAPTAFDWVSSALDTINITKSNLADAYTLQWDASTDVDGETINYLIYAKIGLYLTEEVEEITDTTFQLIYEEILEHVFEGQPINAATVRFSIKATDGIDTVDVTGDDRVLFVNRYEYLSTVGEGVPVEFALHENYPNPFNPTTTLRFDLPEVSNLTLTIYNMLGQKVRTFNMQSTPAGYHSVKWNATNDYGDPVGAGVYLYQLQTKDFVKTRKMVLLK